ncbi:MAG: catalase family protein [Bdellovibrionota bacterium]
MKILLPALQLILCSALILSCTPAKKIASKPTQGKRALTSQETESDIDSDLGEEFEENEEKLIDTLGGVLLTTLERDFPNPTVPRDAHAKAHACVHASFKVENSSLPESLRVGVFAENGKEFPAWVRFSNGNGQPRGKDKDQDVRGFAIKLMNVEGDKLLSSERQERTQDFLMVNSSEFFIKDLANYVQFVLSLQEGNPLKYLLLHPKDFYILMEAQRQKVSNPLHLSFFGATPYRLGSLGDPNRKAVKMSAVPCAASAESPADTSDPDLLRKAMVSTLSQSSACFEFRVQLRSDEAPESMPIEDATVHWRDQKALFHAIFSPWIKVATIQIPQQQFDTDRQNTFCENLSFTPWHSLPEHRPLGRTNRARRKVYEVISKYRHLKNLAPRGEPDPGYQP